MDFSAISNHCLIVSPQSGLQNTYIKQEYTGIPEASQYNSLTDNHRISQTNNHPSHNVQVGSRPVVNAGQLMVPRNNIGGQSPNNMLGQMGVVSSMMRGTGLSLLDNVGSNGGSPLNNNYKPHVKCEQPTDPASMHPSYPSDMTSQRLNKLSTNNVKLQPYNSTTLNQTAPQNANNLGQVSLGNPIQNNSNHQGGMNVHNSMSADFLGSAAAGGGAGVVGSLSVGGVAGTQLLKQPTLNPIDMEQQEEEKTRRKRERNRIAAAKCREKKVKKIDFLETQVKDLKDTLVNTQLERDYYKVKCNNIVDVVNQYIRNSKVEIPIVEISKIIEQQSADDTESKQNQAHFSRNLSL